MWLSIVSIGAGASCGAVLRWIIGVRLNALFPTIPPGTLVANLLGAYIIGLAIAVFAAAPNLSPYWRLFIVTGFLGALTTFSSFSAEMFSLIESGRISWALVGVFAHVAGSLLMTFLGVGTITIWRTLAG